MIHHGDALEVLRTLPEASVQCCVSSPPYWGLRDYGVEGQFGLERTPEEYVEKMVAVFEEVRRVLKPDGTLWLNLGDSYAGSWGAQSRPDGNDENTTVTGGSMLSARQIKAHPKRTGTGSLKNTPGLKPKDLVGIPWRVAFAIQAAGWWLRADIIWHKPNPMPESILDRPTKAHEYVFLMAKSDRYYYNIDAIREPRTTSGAEGNSGEWERNTATSKHGEDPRYRTRPGSRPPDYFGHPIGRNKRSVWSITTKPFPGSHFAVMPEQLALTCILAGSRPGDVVMDPFSGAGTVGVVAEKTGRRYIGIELNADYVAMSEARIRNVAPLFHEAEG